MNRVYIGLTENALKNRGKILMNCWPFVKLLCHAIANTNPIYNYIHTGQEIKAC